MKGFRNGLKWITAAALIMSVTAAPAFAVKTTPATDKNTNVPAVPRAIPDLIPYHKFDPPKSKLFDIKNLTISGDIRVRPEFRTNNNFGVTGTALQTGVTGVGAKNNANFVQQWVRLGFNYAISPDVDFFLQTQYSKNWGALAADPNSSGGTIFARQAFMLIRNAGIKNLTVKAGRQLVVWGNHRLFGHFDWNNVGWAFDGLQAQYKLMDNVTIETAWLRVAETNCASAVGGGCGAFGTATSDADILFVRAPMKFMGITFEPAWVWESGGGGGNAGAGATVNGITDSRPANQSRHTIGGRITTVKSISNLRVDATFEGYYQFGKVGATTLDRSLDIKAYAIHLDGGVTLPVPMQPRIGGEFNYSPGDGNAAACQSAATVTTTAAQNAACSGNQRTFSQLFPTNHIHFGYMDKMAWKNMVEYAANLQLRPTKNSHLDISGHIFRLASTGDNWYGANQQILFNAANNATRSASIGQEIDAVYTLFFTEGNKVGWQIGGGVFMPGALVEQNLKTAGLATGGVPNETWGYTQLWINF